MFFIMSDGDHSAEFVSCGNLLNEENFIHAKRKLDYFVLIFVKKGCLYIRQREHNFEVRENQFILLLPNETHYGYKPSPGYLSYYWVHFHLYNPKLLTSNEFQLNYPFGSSFLAPFSPHMEIPNMEEFYFIPEYGTLPSIKRSFLLFAQLLDVFKRSNYASKKHCFYSLNTFLLEFSKEMITELSEKSSIENPLENIIEWIRRNCSTALSVQSIAKEFNYSPDYLSGLFKKYTGYSLLVYINLMRLTKSKDMLINTNLPIRIISQNCGFTDEKYFFRFFKKHTGITPHSFRKSFELKYIVVD